MSTKQWTCICGFTHQFINVQLHFLSEHKVVLDECVSCGICKIKFNDPVLLKQHSVIHIQRYSSHIQDDSENKLHVSASKVASAKDKDYSNTSSSLSCNMRSLSNNLDNNSEQQQSIRSSLVASVNAFEKSNTKTCSRTCLQSRNVVALASLSSASDQLNNNSLLLNQNQGLLNIRITGGTVNFLHPQLIDQTSKQYLNSSSALRKETNSLTIQKTSTAGGQNTSQILNGSDDCKMWSTLKSNSALNKMMQPDKLVHFYKCMEKECSFTTNDNSDFLMHLARHNISYFKCVYCFSDFASGIFLINHILEKHGNRQYQCGLCLYRASRKLYVVVHHQVHHKNDDLNVLICVPSQAIKTNERALDVDYSSYAKAYCCSIGMCHFETFDPEDFRMHNNMHHGTVCMFPCSYCEASCFSVGRLIQHYQLHGINNYQCTYCLYGSTTKLQLLFHLSVMHADMPVNVYIRSSHEPTVDLQNSFINDSGYNELSSLTKSSNSEVTTSFTNDVIDIIEPSEIKLENGLMHEVPTTAVSIENNEVQLNKCNESVVNFESIKAEATSTQVEKNDPVFSSVYNTEKKEQLNLNSAASRSNEVVDLTHSNKCKINSLKRKCLDEHSVVKKSLCQSSVDPDVQIYDCCICSASLLSLFDAKRHLKTVHCINHLVRCRYCAKSGMCKEVLRYHIITKHINKDVIVHSFIRKRIHKKTKVRYQYKCVFCIFGTHDKETMLGHLYKELNYNTYSCGICRIQLLNDTNIVNHFMSNHPDECIIFTKERNHYIETWIEKVFQNLPTTQIFSPNNNVLYCPLCHRELPNIQKLRWHLYEHKQYKQYRCNHCNKQFVKLSHFNKHKTAIAETNSEAISVSKIKVQLIERWAKEIIQNITMQNVNSNNIRRNRHYVKNIRTRQEIFFSKLNNNALHNRRKSMYTNLDIHLAGIYKCHYCCFCTNNKYAVERHCRIKHFNKHAKFFAAGKISRIKKILGNRLHLVQCWQCKEKLPKHVLKRHRLKYCRGKPYDKHSHGKKRKLNNCNSRKKYNIHEKISFSNTRTNGDIRQLYCSNDHIFSCYCCQMTFCSLKLFYKHWQNFHSYNNGPFMFRLPIMATEYSSKTCVYKCSYCNSKSSLFNVLKDHIAQYHPSRIFKVKIVREATENVHLHKNKVSESECDVTVDYISEQTIIENNLCTNEESKVIDDNITVNVKVEGLSSNLRLPVTYLARLCNIQPIIILKDILLDS